VVKSAEDMKFFKIRKAGDPHEEVDRELMIVSGCATKC